MAAFVTRLYGNPTEELTILPDRIRWDTKVVVLNVEGAEDWKLSSFLALAKLCCRLRKRGQRLILYGLPPGAQCLLDEMAVKTTVAANKEAALVMTGC